jgi:hypothetical protein
MNRRGGLSSSSQRGPSIIDSTAQPNRVRLPSLRDGGMPDVIRHPPERDSPNRSVDIMRATRS